MIREKWNADWKFKKGGPSLMGSLMGGEDDSIVVQLPGSLTVQ